MGANFNPAGGNIIRFGSEEASYIEYVSASEIRVRVPVNIYTNEFKASVTTASQTGVYSTLTSPWTKINDSPESLYQGISFVHDNQAYVGLGGNGYNIPFSTKIWRFSPISDSWFEFSNFPGGERGNCIFFKVGSKGYIGAGYNGYPYKTFYNDFWEYDFITDQWSQKNSMPFTPENLARAKAYLINETGYLIVGTELWKYNQGTDIWIKKSDLPGSFVFSPQGFGIDGNLYVLGLHDSSSPGYKMWKYSVISGEWTYLIISPQEFLFDPFVIEVKGSIYIGSSGSQELWKYAHQSNEFILEPPYGGNARYGCVSFVINEKGYIVSGNETVSFTGPSNTCWKFDPDY